MVYLYNLREMMISCILIVNTNECKAYPYQQINDTAELGVVYNVE